MVYSNIVDESWVYAGPPSPPPPPRHKRGKWDFVPPLAFPWAKSRRMFRWLFCTHSPCGWCPSWGKRA
eukprot:1427166-Pyramimonas_sp.AAC.1